MSYSATLWSSVSFKKEGASTLSTMRKPYDFIDARRNPYGMPNNLLERIETDPQVLLG